MDTVAFPSVSTGAYGFPLERAAAIAVREVVEFLARNPYPRKVIFCAFGTRGILDILDGGARSSLNVAHMEHCTCIHHSTVRTRPGAGRGRPDRPSRESQWKS